MQKCLKNKQPHIWNKKENLKMKKVKENLKLIVNIFLLSHRFDSKITLYEFLHGLCMNLRRVINVVFPAYIVNIICERKTWKHVLLTAIVYGLLQGIFSCGDKCFKLLQEAHGFRACNLLRLSMNKKFMRVDYADTENANVLDAFEEAKDSMWEFCDVGYVLFDDIIGNLITFICMSYILADINTFLYLFVLLLIGINLSLQHKRNKFIHESELKEKTIKKFMDYVSGLMQDYKVGKEIRVFQLRKFMDKKYVSFSNQYKEHIRIKEGYIVKISILQSIINFGQLFVVYISAIRKYVHGYLPIGYFLLYISSISELTESIKNLLAAFVELSKVSSYYKDYERFINIPENLRLSGKEDIVMCNENVIELVNVSYYYPNSDIKAINNVSLKISDKDKIGIVGENGSGKSTLIKLLLRLYEPTEGVIYFNGKDIRLYEYEQYLAVFNTVFQDFSTFAYSILENITFDDNVDYGKLNIVIKKTGFSRNIEKYKYGIKSNVTKILDDEGVNLSGGEMQLLAITRAFYHNARVLVFDEPTAALDPIKETEIFELIKDMSVDKMTIFCAHRMSSTKFCNKIIVMKDGRICEMGTHQELLKQEGIYYDLFVKQASLYKQELSPLNNSVIA